MGTRITLALMLTAVTASVAAGLMVVGSPTTQRQKRLDEKRIEDLAGIRAAVDQYRSAHNELPRVLGELDAGDARWRHHDPLTLQPYEYRMRGGDGYELCATFQQPSDRQTGGWQHGTGRQCFVLVARPKRPW
jgi:hypothetical protein